jgi:phosphoglycerate dehydrogenase-like enzyme
MTGLLLGPRFAERYQDRLDAIERETGAAFERILLPEDPEARVPADAVARVEVAFFSGDVFPELSPAFFSATLSAPKLRWLHCFNAGLDHPIFSKFGEKGVVLTSSPGSNVEQATLAVPPDLDTQTLVVLGLGGIGSEIARLGRALGLHVVGVRRSRPTQDAPIDAWAPPAELPELLPRADWLAIACPLTEETRGWIDATALARLPDGACLLNVGRGEIVEESALVAELESGRLGGAYLDVFEVEPLPVASPLWTLPNVIVTPHSSSISSGAPQRQAEMFLANLERFVRGEPLANAAPWPAT